MRRGERRRGTQTTEWRNGKRRDREPTLPVHIQTPSLVAAAPPRVELRVSGGGWGRQEFRPESAPSPAGRWGGEEQGPGAACVSYIVFFSCKSR